MAKYNPQIEGEERRLNEDGYKTDQTQNIVMSHLKLSRYLGVLGALLPIILILGSGIYNSEILPSISYYYYSLCKVLFIGIISAISVFLLTYNGFDMWESLICKVAGFFAFLIAVCPTSIQTNHLITDEKTYYKTDFSKFIIPSTANQDFISYIHYFSATVFFVLLSILILWKFVDHENDAPTPSKEAIRIYKITGWLMVFSIFMIAIKGIVISVFKISLSIPYTFIFETLALVSFGVAWMVKGEIQRILHQK